MKQFLVAASAVVGFVAFTSNAQAKPEYARKEKKACAYCHIKEEGGGPRNPRGVFYAMHAKSFEGYDEAKVMGANAIIEKKTGSPAFKSAWTMDAPAGSTRISLADMAGDKSSRALVATDSGKLTIYKFADAKFTVENEVEIGKSGSHFAAGVFSKGKPACIVVPGAIFHSVGDKFTKTATTDISDVTGTVMFTSGETNVFFFAGGMPDVYAVDPSAAKPVSGGREMVPPDQGAGVYANLTIHPPAELLGGLGIPEQGAKVGVLGLFDPRSEGKLFAWIPWAGADGYTLIVTDAAAIGGGGGGDLKPLWSSPKLTGKILDVAAGMDPKNPKKTGLLVLTSSGDGGKDRKLEFFALD